MRWKFHYPKNLDSRNYLNLNESLGWLMGLEPTTTGITIRCPITPNYLILNTMQVNSLELPNL